MARSGTDVIGDGRRPQVVIVGAGFGGLSAAGVLARADVDITLIDRQNHHLFQPLLYQVATAALSPADIAAPVRAIVKRQPHTRVLLDEVVGVDTAQRRVMLASGALAPYDALVLATGARHSYFGRDDWAAHAPGIKTIDDALSVRRRILLALETAETIRQEHLAERDEFLTFVIIGGGPTGVEMAGAVAELTRQAVEMDFRLITRRCVRIILIEASDRLLASFPMALSLEALRALERLDVEVRLGARVTAIEEHVVMVGEERIAAATVIWAAGVQASPAAAWLGAAADRAGRLIVGADLAAPGLTGVYAIGDTAAVTDAAGRLSPGVAPAAKQQGEHVGRAVAAFLAGAPAPKSYRYRNFGNLATIGRMSAVVDLGWLRLHGLAAWLLWSTAHLYFLVGFRNRFVVGANWMWNYVTFDRGARLITGIDPPQ